MSQSYLLLQDGSRLLLQLDGALLLQDSPDPAPGRVAAAAVFLAGAAEVKVFSPGPELVEVDS